MKPRTATYMNKKEENQTYKRQKRAWQGVRQTKQEKEKNKKQRQNKIEKNKNSLRIKTKTISIKKSWTKKGKIKLKTAWEENSKRGRKQGRLRVKLPLYNPVEQTAYKLRTAPIPGMAERRISTNIP